MKINHLTPSEEILMSILWKLDCAYMKDVIAHYPEPKPHQNTISTFLKILVEKNYLVTEKQGRIYLYSPAVSWEDYKKIVTKKFAESYFDNSGIDLLKLLMEENLIQAKDFNQFFEVKTTVVALQETEKDNPVRDLVNELTSEKKSKKKDKDKKKKKKK